MTKIRKTKARGTGIFLSLLIAILAAIMLSGVGLAQAATDDWSINNGPRGGFKEGFLVSDDEFRIDITPGNDLVVQKKINSNWVTIKCLLKDSGKLEPGSELVC